MADTQFADPATEVAEEAPTPEIAAEAATTEPTPGETAKAPAKAGTFMDTGMTPEEIHERGTKEQLIALFNAEADGWTPDAAPEEITGQETQQEPEAGADTDTPGDGTPEETADTGAEGADESQTGDSPKLPKRIKPAGTAEDRARMIAVNDLMKEEGIGMIEAIQRLGFMPQAQATPEPTAEAVAPNVTAQRPDAALAAAREKVAALVKQQAEARAAFDTEADARLQMEILDATAELTEVRDAAKRSAQSIEAANAKAVSEVRTAIPELSRKDSPLAREVLRLESVMEKADPTFFTRPRPNGRTWAQELGAMAWAAVHPGEAMPPVLVGKSVPQKVQAHATSQTEAKPSVAPIPAVPRKNGAPAAAMLRSAGAQRPTDINSLANIFNDPRATKQQLIEAANKLAEAETLALRGRR